jgi:hypothetical protein
MEGILKSITERNDPDLVPLNIVERFSNWMDQLTEFYKDKDAILRDE